MSERLPHEKGFHVSWDQIHRDARALAWRLDGKGPDNGQWKAVVAIRHALVQSKEVSWASKSCAGIQVSKRFVSSCSRIASSLVESQMRASKLQMDLLASSLCCFKYERV